MTANRNKRNSGAFAVCMVPYEQMDQLAAPRVVMLLLACLFRHSFVSKRGPRTKRNKCPADAADESSSHVAAYINA